jgi:hypothetical protein
VLFARPLTDAERPATPVWLDTVVVKLADADTRTLYVVAPVTVPQVRVGEVAWFAALSAGEESVGDTGGPVSVVKLHAPDHAQVIPYSRGLTCQ